MKIQNILRMQIVVMGFAAAMMLPSSVHAQEIDNTVWNDTQTAAPAAQPAPVQPAPATAVDETSTATETGAITLAPMNAKRVVAQESSVSQWTPDDRWMVSSLLVCIGLVIIYALAEAKRANRTINESRTARMNRSIPLF